LPPPGRIAKAITKCRRNVDPKVPQPQRTDVDYETEGPNAKVISSNVTIDSYEKEQQFQCPASICSCGLL
jgi:hypothetical protein